MRTVSELQIRREHLPRIGPGGALFLTLPLRAESSPGDHCSEGSKINFILFFLIAVAVPPGQGRARQSVSTAGTSGPAHANYDVGARSHELQALRGCRTQATSFPRLFVASYVPPRTKLAWILEQRNLCQKRQAADPLAKKRTGATVFARGSDKLQRFRSSEKPE